MQERATIFGAEAERYDRTRPDYPAELVDALVPRAPMSVLDVGCGTGIASRLFAQRGCSVLGVEADARMAAVATARGTAVEVSALRGLGRARQAVRPRRVRPGLALGSIR